MIKLIAIGNRLMGDDGVAILVAEHIADQLESMGIALFIGETDIYYCLDQIEEDDFLIVMDAEFKYSNDHKNNIEITPLHKAVSASQGYCFSHESSILELIRLYQISNEGILMGILIPQNDSVKIGQELSKTIQDNFIRICSDVIEFLIRLNKKALEE